MSKLKFKILSIMDGDIVNGEIEAAYALIDEILNEHAHELAEEVRNLGGIWDSQDVMDAADAIDPEVKK